MVDDNGQWLLEEDRVLRPKVQGVSMAQGRAEYVAEHAQTSKAIWGVNCEALSVFKYCLC